MKSDMLSVLTGEELMSAKRLTDNEIIIIEKEKCKCGCSLYLFKGYALHPRESKYVLECSKCGNIRKDISDRQFVLMEETND